MVRALPVTVPSVVRLGSTSHAAGDEKFTFSIVTLTFRVRRTEAKCYNLLVTAVCVSACLSLVAFLYYCTDPHVTWGNGMGIWRFLTYRATVCIVAWQSTSEIYGNVSNFTQMGELGPYGTSYYIVVSVLVL